LELSLIWNEIWIKIQKSQNGAETRICLKYLEFSEIYETWSK
jgi:hypothetical protein